MKKIVVLGGGNGTALGIRALKPFIPEFELSAVVSVADSGGSSGRLRREFSVLPPGDLLRAVLALSPYDYLTLRQIFYKNRFKNTGRLDGHNIGNMFLTLGANYSGDIVQSLRALEQGVEAQGPVHPVSLDDLTLCVRLSNGDVVRGEAEIDRPSYDRSLRIKQAWLEPEGKIFEPSRAALEQADYVVMVLGSLYTSVVQNLLVGGVKDALTRSRAQYICVAGNACEAFGETGPTVLSELVTGLEQYLPRKIDVVVCNNAVLSEQQKKRYQEKEWTLFAQDLDNLADRKCVQGNFEKAEGGMDAEKMGRLMYSFLK